MRCDNSDSLATLRRCDEAGGASPRRWGKYSAASVVPGQPPSPPRTQRAPRAPATRAYLCRNRRTDRPMLPGRVRGRQTSWIAVRTGNAAPRREVFLLPHATCQEGSSKLLERVLERSVIPGILGLERKEGGWRWKERATHRDGRNGHATCPCNKGVSVQ